MKNRSRVVWITGASTGIGRSLSETFASRGDIVIASARDPIKLKDLQLSVKKKKGICETLVCDVRKDEQVSKAVNRITKEHDQIDILINNAGVSSFRSFKNTSIKDFDNIIQTNLRGAFLVSKAVIPLMLKFKHGMLINVISYITKEVYPGSSAYSASKAGVEAMFNVLRAEVRKEGINVVNVFPGAVSTAMWDNQKLKEYGDQMLEAGQVSEMIYEISIQPPSLMVEEVILRPCIGDVGR